MLCLIISVGNIYTNVTLKYSCQLSSLAPHSLSYGLADWPKEQKANESWREHEKEDSTRVEVMSRALEYRVGRYLAPSIECFALAFQFHISVLIIKLFCYVM